MYEQQKIYIVVEKVNGQGFGTRLEKEQAETLYRKLRTAGAEVDIFKEVTEFKEDKPVEIENETW